MEKASKQVQPKKKKPAALKVSSNFDALHPQKPVVIHPNDRGNGRSNVVQNSIGNDKINQQLCEPSPPLWYSLLQPTSE